MSFDLLISLIIILVFIAVNYITDIKQGKEIKKFHKDLANELNSFEDRVRKKFSECSTNDMAYMSHIQELKNKIAELEAKLKDK